MKIFLEINGEQYGYINNSIPDSQLNIVHLSEAFYKILTSASLMPENIDVYLEKLDKKIDDLEGEWYD